MSITFLKAALVGVVLTISSAANAAIIEFIYTGTGSGTLGGQAFTDSRFTITETSNTENIQSCEDECVFIDAMSTTISIENVGQFDFLSGTRTFYNGEVVGFSRAGAFGSDLYNAFVIDGFDMMSAVGPVVANASLIQWARGDVNTTGGILIFGLQDVNGGTFEARVSSVPVPASIGIFALSLIGLAYRNTKKS
jgi:hypothetical protein